MLARRPDLDELQVSEPNYISPSSASVSRQSLSANDIIIGLALAYVAFLAYWFLGPQDTWYSYQVSQANNIIHGHLDLRPEHTRNMDVLEQVLFDGERFCLPPGDQARLNQIVQYADAIDAGMTRREARALVVSNDCKVYMQHALGPALLVIPGVAIWGVGLNQTLVSAIFGALTAIVVFAIARHLTPNRITQIGLSILFLFGTIFFWVAANGGVWMFAHTTAVFFLSGAIYFTLVRRSPLVAGILLGAAFMCRPTVLMTGLFFVVAFSDMWLRPQLEGQSPLKRIDWMIAVRFAAGLAPFMLLTFAANYLRYDNPFESGYNYVESSHQVYLRHLYNEGSFDFSYIGRHPPVVFGGMPFFQSSAPYVLPAAYGMAIWLTTPAFLYSFFANIGQHRAIVAFGAVSLALACVFMLENASAGLFGLDPAEFDSPFSLPLLPFYLMTAVAIVAAVLNRDRINLACWMGIVPTVFLIFNFAFVGYSQFGYRYSLDFMPFLWILTARAIGDEMKWHHWALIGLGVTVNLWGVLWFYEFGPNELFGVETWVEY
jgi:hypothetical protein